MENQDKITYWQQLFKEYDESGLSLSEFCNKKKNAIKVLRYDKNGFILATKKLLEGMKFQWPKDTCDVRLISREQVNWLLQGLEIEQKKALKELDIYAGNTCF